MGTEEVGVVSKSYKRVFHSEIWGFQTTTANSIEEANQKFDEGDYNQHDTKSEYEYGEIK